MEIPMMNAALTKIVNGPLLLRERGREWSMIRLRGLVVSLGALSKWSVLSLPQVWIHQTLNHGRNLAKTIAGCVHILSGVNCASNG
jgi:hypothetical protein